jgi:hypothetical protein
MPMQLSRAQCTPLSATPHRCRKAAKVLTRVVQGFVMLSRLKPLLMHCALQTALSLFLFALPYGTPDMQSQSLASSHCFCSHQEPCYGIVQPLKMSIMLQGPCVIRSAEVPSYHAQRTHAKTQRVRVKSWCSRFCTGLPYITLLLIVDTKSLSHRSFTPAPLLLLPAKEPRCQPPYRNPNLMGHIMAKVRRPFMDLTLGQPWNDGSTLCTQLTHYRYRFDSRGLSFFALLFVFPDLEVPRPLRL